MTGTADLGAVHDKIQNTVWMHVAVLIDALLVQVLLRYQRLPCTDLAPALGN
jgi:hypothetical protein